MTLAGERIQALFSELTLEDQNVTPPFAITWLKMQSRACEPKRKSLQSLGFAVVVVVAIAVLSFMFWPSSQDKLQVPSLVSGPAPVSAPTMTVVRKSNDLQRKSIKVRHRVNRSAGRYRELVAREALMISNASVISSWRSPTETLMESPASSVLRSVPNLNESVKDLESFLSNNEVKEWNE